MKFAIAALSATVSLALVSASASAQLAAYGMVTANRLGGLTYTTQGYTPNTSYTTRTDGSIYPIGGTGGIFYDFKQIGPVRLGVDGRFTIASTDHGADPSAAGSGGRLYTVLGGLRASFPAHYRILAPYAQASFGLGRSDFGVGAASNASTTTPGPVQVHNGFAYQGFLGLDIHALPYLDVRVPEVGIGGLSGISGQNGSHVIQSLSVGLVFRLP